MKIVDILLEKKTKKKKAKKHKTKNMYSSSYRSPVIGFGSWYWSGGVPMDAGADGGDGGGD